MKNTLRQAKKGRIIAYSILGTLFLFIGVITLIYGETTAKIVISTASIIMFLWSFIQVMQGIKVKEKCVVDYHDGAKRLQEHSNKLIHRFSEKVGVIGTLVVTDKVNKTKEIHYYLQSETPEYINGRLFATAYEHLFDPTSVEGTNDYIVFIRNSSTETFKRNI